MIDQLVKKWNALGLKQKVVIVVVAVVLLGMLTA
jgi:hypothetical protein